MSLLILLSLISASSCCLRFDSSSGFNESPISLRKRVAISPNCSFSSSVNLNFSSIIHMFHIKIYRKVTKKWQNISYLKKKSLYL